MTRAELSRVPNHYVTMPRSVNLLQNLNTIKLILMLASQVFQLINFRNIVIVYSGNAIYVWLFLFVFLAPVSLTIFCRSLLDAGRSRFLCPYISQDKPPVYCGKEWDYIVVRRLAVLTENEKKEFENKISKNHLIKAMGIQECPNCKSLVERINKKDIRVACSLCRKKLHKDFQFCWHCLHEWANGASSSQCGETFCLSL